MNYFEEDGIEHRQTTPLWPQANGEIKRHNFILKCLRITQAEGCHWKSEMDNFLMILIVPNILLLGLAHQNCCLEDASGPNYPSPSSASKMRCEIMTVREKKEGRCMQTAKGMHVKAKFIKAIRCYGSLRRPEKENKLSSRHTNSKANGI